ncbi:MAG: hypothetical protein KY468_12325 [Armatimonadetes bacterium]|nr:hypothetical protein [Armatimonadota bacterium]
MRVSPWNPRYFEDRTGKIVYLTGSHTWTNLIDRGPTDPPPVFDYGSYLDFLQEHHHNFIRLWSRHVSRYQHEYGEKELHASPLPWRRTGPGTALDGKPKFNLTKFDPAYFDRLRSRVRAARDRGIYVSIMLFGGYQEVRPNWTGNPFHRDNNINGIDGDPNRDGRGSETQILAGIPNAVAKVQKQYVRKVIDTVNDLDNVLFEICNECEGTSQDWQYDMIRFIHRYERMKAMQHPVGMTMADWSPRETRARLDASPAEWVSYYFQVEPPQGQEGFSVHDPFVANNRKVSVMDSDHWWVVPIYGNTAFGRDWVWKSFSRGHNPILMEHLPPLSLVMKEVPLTLDDPGYIASRQAMGQTRRMANRMNLAAMTPRNDLSSTGYCLANMGREYLTYLPDGGEVTVDLSTAKGIFQAEWVHPITGRRTPGKTERGGGKRPFKAPFDGAAVLYLNLKTEGK